MSVTGMLTICTETGVARLARSLASAANPGEFLASIRDFHESQEETLQLEWNFGNSLPQLAYEQRGGNLLPGLEAENAVKVFEYLGDMKPVEASDYRLWTYLGCSTLFDYTSHRWPLDNQSWKGTVETRWIMRTGSRSQLVRHAIARLWWAAKLTHDPTMARPMAAEQQDPYAYLRVALSKEDRFLALFDRDTGMVPELRFAILEHLGKDPAFLKEGYVRELMKEVVLVAGYRELAAIDRAGLHSILDEISFRLVEAHEADRTELLV
ncbi:DUF6339 family protein [Arthrobacter sp. SD76]|uniref:DUF6339 family protein n=1 Tax=Arthrobacter sp. SD76 TaxID=3415007 RepID=UPI003C71C6A2